MFSSLSFRYKILLSYAVLLIAITTIIYLASSYLVENVVINSMEKQIDDLIYRISEASNDQKLIENLREEKYMVFFRIGIINDKNELLYDTYSKRLVETGREAPKLLQYPDVQEAFKTGLGISKRLSKRLEQEFVYMSKAFDFNGKMYVLRTAFPMSFVSDLTANVKWTLLAFSSTVLFLFSFISWMVINTLTRPIQQIIKTIRPFQEGKTSVIPTITLSQGHSDDEFSRLAVTLNSLSEKIQQQIKMQNKLLDMRRDFIANASHELKTPITIINGFAETMHDNPELPGDTMRMITEKIMRNCLRMTNVVKDLLVLTDLDSSTGLKISECNLKMIVDQCSQNVLDLYKDAHIEINLDSNEDFIIEGESNLLEMAMMNLLENAAKYSTSPAYLTVGLQKMGDWIELSIADRGMGIPEGDLEHIFERFYTVNKARSRKLGGAGLGLSLVYSVIQKHEGQISVQSEVGKGTVFIVKLPIRQSVEKSHV